MRRHVQKIATKAGRDYITPEDVGDALEAGAPLEDVRVEVLQVIGKAAGFGAEDASLCAYIAWNRGKAKVKSRG